MAKPNSKNDKRVDVRTGVGTLSFPHIFKETVSKNDDGEPRYETQFLIPKSDTESVKAILAGIREVAEAKWGDNWKSVASPLRDGDKEAKLLTEDASARGEKYPERLGCYFLNARSARPVGVVDRERNPIVEPTEVYAGCKARLNVTLYPYVTKGNQGVGVGLNGVQKVADGESLGGGAPSVESMFDMLGDDDGDGLADVEEKPKKKKKKKA